MKIACNIGIPKFWRMFLDEHIYCINIGMSSTITIKDFKNITGKKKHFLIQVTVQQIE